MKKILLLVVLLSSTFCFAQTQMNQEEYNYLTKGLKVEKENGLDGKKNYLLKLIHTQQGRVFNIKISKLIKEDTNKFKGFSIVINPDTRDALYLAFPISNLELRKDYELKISQLSSIAKDELISALTQMFATEVFVTHK